MLVSNEVEDKGQRRIFNSGREKFNFNLLLQITNKVTDGAEVFGFCSPCANEQQTAMLINQLPVLRLFLKKFQEDNRFLVSKLEDNQINIADLVGPNFYEGDSVRKKIQAVKKQAFLEKMGLCIGSPLSLVEQEVLRLILLGNSAPQIAEHLFRSRRTIEHHIERIKGKFGCGSKTELVQKGRELEALGCLIPKE